VGLVIPALLLACAALVEKGAEVLMPDPSYPCNRHFVSAFEGVATLIPSGPEHRFQLSEEMVRSHWSAATRGVLLASRASNEGLRIEVWDTGVGIAREHQQAIFQEFYRIPQPGTDEGFGLGLAIVSGLSRALGHPVGMVSRVGRGSVFWVQLPVLQTSPAALRTQQTEQSP